MNNNKELHIIMTNGDKKSELRIQDFHSEFQLTLIDGMFKFFDINVNISEMINVYKKSGEAFKDFYEPINNRQLTETNEQIEVESATEALVTETDTSLLEEAYKTKKLSFEENPDIRTYGKDVCYKCRYICPSCKNKGNRYILPTDAIIECHDCYRKMYVKTSTADGFPHQDRFGNYFIAGKFERDYLSMQKTKASEGDDVSGNP